MKLKQFLACALAAAMLAGLSGTAAFAAASAWDGAETDTAWYSDSESSFTIGTAAELAGLARW